MYMPISSIASKVSKHVTEMMTYGINYSLRSMPLLKSLCIKRDQPCFMNMSTEWIKSI